MTELLHPPQKELVFAKPTTAKDLLGVDFQEPENLSLLTAPMYIASQERQDGTTKYSAVVEHPLDGLPFFNLLNHLSPIFSRSAIEEVVADWDMPDDKSEEAKKLNNDHAKNLQEAWKDFMLHRRIFINAISADKGELWKVVESRKILKQNPDFTFKINDAGLHVDFRQEEGKRTATLSKKATQVLTVETIEVLGSDGTIIKLKIMPDTFNSLSFIIPVITWTVDKYGRRNIILDLLNKSTTGFKNSYTYNSLAGFLMLPYFFEDVSQRWPKRHGYAGNGDPRLMGPAQVPILALMRKEEISATPFFEKAEKYVATL